MKIDFSSLLAAAYLPTIILSAITVILFVPWSIRIWRREPDLLPRKFLVTGAAVTWVGQLVNGCAQMTYFLKGEHLPPFELEFVAASIITARLILITGDLLLLHAFVIGFMERNSRIVWPALTFAIVSLYVLASLVLFPAFQRTTQ